MFVARPIPAYESRANRLWSGLRRTSVACPSTPSHRWRAFTRRRDARPRWGASRVSHGPRLLHLFVSRRGAQRIFLVKAAVFGRRGERKNRENQRLLKKVSAAPPSLWAVRARGWSGIFATKTNAIEAARWPVRAMLGHYCYRRRACGPENEEVSRRVEEGRRLLSLSYLVVRTICLLRMHTGPCPYTTWLAPTTGVPALVAEHLTISSRLTEVQQC